MRVLFDQATPVPIRQYLTGHDVSTAAQQGWETLKNGELLTATEAAGFEVLLTTDKNMIYQQNLAGRKIAVLYLGNNSGRSFSPMFNESCKPSIPPHRASMSKSRYPCK